MIPHEIPDRPWAKVGADIFSFKNQEYLVVVDYYSKFPEVEQLTCKTANGVISALRQIFSRHGIPEILFCDNMPFASHVMASFAEEMGFEIITSSPRYAQSNGQSEKFVGIVKSFMRKAHEEGRDIWMSLLYYRNTPITGAPYSPAQLLMSRKLRDKMPSTSNILKPSVVPDGQSTMKRRHHVKSASTIVVQLHVHHIESETTYACAYTTGGIALLLLESVTHRGHIRSPPRMVEPTVETRE